MPFFIPFIIGAIAAGSIGTSVANTAMDGALFAPEIKGYKADIAREQAANQTLVDEINRRNVLFDGQVARINESLELANRMADSFLALESEAVSLATQVVLDESDQFPIASELEQGTLSVVAAGGILTLGSFQVGGLLNTALTETRLGKAVGLVDQRFQTAFRGLIQSPRLSSISKSRAVVRIAQRAPVTAQVLNASARAAQLGAKTGARAASSAAAKLAGPFSIVLDVGFLIADIIASQEKAREYKKIRDELVVANRALRVIQDEVDKAQVALNEDEVILNRETLELVKYAGMILAYNFDDTVDELPASMQDIEALKNMSSFDATDLNTLVDFIERRGSEFVTRRNSYYLSIIKKLKGYLDACGLAPEALVYRVSFVGTLGLDFIRFLAETQFSDVFAENIVSESCSLTLNDAQPVNGLSVRSAELDDGMIRQVSDGYWVYTDGRGNHHPYGELGRDEWSVYLASRKHATQQLQLDLWRRELITSSESGEGLAFDRVKTAYSFERNDFELVSAAPYELDQDRPGADYRSTHGVNANECARECGVDPVCRAFTFSPENGVCYLKDATPAQHEQKHSRLRSGVKL